MNRIYTKYNCLTIVTSPIYLLLLLLEELIPAG